MGSQASTATAFLRRLVTPSRRVVTDSERRTASMLAASALAFIVLFATVDGAYSLTVPDYSPPWFGYAILVAIYALARSRHYKVGAMAVVAMFPCVALIHVGMGRSAYPAVTLGFMSLSPLLAALFLSTRTVPWLGLANAAAMLSLPWVVPDTAPPGYVVAGSAVESALVTALALLYAYHRNQSEADRARTLQVNEANLRHTLEGASLGQWEYDTKRGQFTISARTAEIFGVELASWGGTQDEVLRLVHPEDRQLIAHLIARVRSGAQSVSVEHRLVRKDGQVRWIEVRGRALQDEPHRVLGTIADVTERQSLEAQLRQAQKMEAIGQLAGGVAHDFNNLLTVVLGNVHLLGTRSRSHELEQIEQAALSARALTSQLLAFSRRSASQLQTVDLGQTVDKARSMIQRLIGETIRVVYTPPEEPCLTRADPALVQQALLNLAANGRDAMPEGGTLTFEVGSLPGGTENATGDRVFISVTDDGHGMPASTQKRLFEPFFTTKAQGKGTGLGLAMVQSMMNQVAGDVSVRSELGVGTTMTLSFPRVEGEDPTTEARRAKKEGGHEVILLVEDEQLVRNLCHRVLETAGYEVLVAEDAAQARTHWQQRKPQISLVLSDVVMPETSGPDLAAELLSDRPDLRLLFMSGYAPDLKLEPRAGSTRFISKPFSASALLDEVRDMLGTRASTPAPPRPPRATPVGTKPH